MIKIRVSRKFLPLHDIYFIQKYLNYRHSLKLQKTTKSYDKLMFCGWKWPLSCSPNTEFLNYRRTLHLLRPFLIVYSEHWVYPLGLSPGRDSSKIMLQDHLFLMKTICYELRGKCPLSFCQNSLALSLLSLSRLMGLLQDALRQKALVERYKAFF